LKSHPRLHDGTPGFGNRTGSPELINYALFLQREGYRPSTIQRHLKVLRTFCQFLKETGVRAGEVHNVRWSDLYEGYVNIQPEKHSNPRRIKLSPKLMLIINRLPRKCPRVCNSKILGLVGRE